MPAAKTKSSSRSTSTKKAKTRARRVRTPRLVSVLPEALRTERVVSTAKRLEETRAVQEVERALDRAAAALKDLSGRLSSFEELAEERMDALKTRVIDVLPLEGASLDEVAQGLSERALGELDELLFRIGLVRTSVHDEALAAVERKLRAARKELKSARATSASAA